MNKLTKLILSLTGAGIVSAAGYDAITPPDTAIDKVGAAFEKSEIKGKYNWQGGQMSYVRKVSVPVYDPQNANIGHNETKTLIGELNSSEFIPSVNITKWEGQAKLKVKPNISKVAKKDKKIELSSDGIKYKAGKVGYTMKDNPKASENGGYDLVTTISEKSVVTALNPTNKVYASGFTGYSLVNEMDIESEGLEFSLQPPLNEEQHEGLTCTATECKDKDGKVMVSRPEDVVDSIAVYSDSKAGNYEPMGGYNYMAGKVGDIKRLKCIDANGSWSWGKQEVINGKWRQYCPTDWLNTAIYPISI